MTDSKHTPRWRIAQIDKSIDAIHRELRRRERIKPTSAEAWQSAWDKHPALHDEITALYFRRGFWQLVRDEAENREWQAHMRRQRAIRAAQTRKATASYRAALAKAEG